MRRSNHSRIVSMIYPNGDRLQLLVGRGRHHQPADSQTGVGTIEDREYLGLATVVQRERVPITMKLTYIKQSGESDGEAGDKYIGLDRFGRTISAGAKARPTSTAPSTATTATETGCTGITR